jgi:hypothetical protein
MSRAVHTRKRLLVALLLIVALPAAAAGQEWVTGPGADVDRRGPQSAKPPEDLLSINATLFGALQWVAKSDVAQGKVFAAGSLDVVVTVRPTDNLRIFIDVVGLAGRGPDERLGPLSSLNKNADDSLGREHTLRLMKLILRPSWLEDRILLSVGKIDAEDYFDRNALAEDEGTQFLNAALLTSPMLQAPVNSPGGALRVSWGDWRYAFGVHALEDVDGDLSGVPFIIGEVGRRNIFPLSGHYRLWARVNSLPEDRDMVTWATGVSIDQLITSNFGVFFRAGVSRSQGESSTSHAWSVGFQLTPTWFDRGNDALGVGYSEQRQPDGRERLVEAYYRLTMAEWLSLIANVQWVVSGPNTVTGETNRNVVIPGLRAVLSF